VLKGPARTNEVQRMREFIFPENIVWVLEDAMGYVCVAVDPGQAAILVFSDEDTAQTYAERSGLTGTTTKALHGREEFIQVLNLMVSKEVKWVGVDAIPGRQMACNEIDKVMKQWLSGEAEHQGDNGGNS
jgi:hypothetical protein